MPPRIAVIALPFVLAACASSPAPQATPATAAAPSAPAAAAAPAEKPRIVKSRDGSYDGEMVGTPAPNSGFAKLQIGMSEEEVNKTMGTPPARSHYYESGKRWIPFYYGNDAIRMQALFNGEGCVIYAAGNRFNRTSADLIRIEVDPSGACYKP